MTDFLENKSLDHVLRNTLYTQPATVYSALFSVCPSESTAGTEVTNASSGYARVATTFTTAGVTVAGQSVNATRVTFATLNATVTVVGFGLMDTATVGTGNALFWSTVTTLAFSSGDQPTFPAGGIVIAKSAASASFFPNLPVGFTTVSTEPWDTVPTVVHVANANGWKSDDADGFSALSVTTDAAAATASLDGNTNVFDGHMPVGSGGGSGTWNIENHFQDSGLSGGPYTRLYWAMYVKIPVGWNTNGNVSMKWLWPATDINTGTSNNYTAFMSGSGGHIPYNLNQQGYPGDIDRAPNMNVSVANMEQYFGSYVCIEHLYTLNSATGVADGIMDCYINGTQTHHYTNADHDLSPQGRTWKFGMLKFTNTYGGGPFLVPTDWDILIDRTLIAVAA